mgnify:CR=1 FL=1
MTLLDKVNGYDLEPEFDPETLTYTLNLMSSTMSLKVTAVPYDEEATVSLAGFGYIKKSGTGTITVKEPNVATTTYRIILNKEEGITETAYDFPYTGGVQEFEDRKSTRLNSSH